MLEVTPTTVRFGSAAGESNIPRSAIRRVEASAMTSVLGGELWPEDPSRRRLFFAPIGRMQHAGELYFSDAYIFFPSFQGGLTNRISLGAGMSIVPGLGLDDCRGAVTCSPARVAKARRRPPHRRTTDVSDD